MASSIAVLLVCVSVISILFAVNERRARLYIESANKRAEEAGAVKLSFSDRVHARGIPSMVSAQVHRGESLHLSWTVYLPKSGNYRLVVAISDKLPATGHYLSEETRTFWMPMEFPSEKAGATFPISLLIYQEGGAWNVRQSGLQSKGLVALNIPTDYTKLWGAYRSRYHSTLEKAMIDNIEINGTKETVYPPTRSEKLPLFRWDRFFASLPAARRTNGDLPLADDQPVSDLWSKRGVHRVPNTPTSTTMVWIEPLSTD
jgi:hypothetical protein